MNEFELIHTYFTRSSPSAHVRLGVGDDCAVIAHTDQHDWVISVDSVVEGRHFLPGTAPERIATRAMCAALSDLAAMGASPRCCTLALTIPEVNKSWLQAFSQGLWRIADRFECPLVGGDTTRGPLNLSVQVQGRVAKGQALLRSGASAGERIFVSGSLGDGAAALAWLRGEQVALDDFAPYLESRFFEPEPQIVLGQALLGLAGAAIDISDGLLADLNHICQASDVGAEIDLTRLPIHADWQQRVGAEASREWALSGGDDYQLLFTVAETNIERLARLQLPVVEIGRIVACAPNRETPRVKCFEGAAAMARTSHAAGYQHFE